LSVAPLGDVKQPRSPFHFLHQAAVTRHAVLADAVFLAAAAYFPSVTIIPSMLTEGTGGQPSERQPAAAVPLSASLHWLLGVNRVARPPEGVDMEEPQIAGAEGAR
jgi:hypothetical protein